VNTNPDAIKVLCYGDSNTWGQKPDKTGRYPANVRWTGRLQELLGDDYYIVEEGLGSRTTDLDYQRKPGRNGKAYLVPCLDSHTPLNVVILMLGTNDLKIEFRRSAQDIAQAIEGLVSDIRQYSQDKNGNPPKIVLVSPIHIDNEAPYFAELYTDYYDEHSAQESHKLAAAFSEIAQKTGCEFVDAASASKAGDDGIHFGEASEAPLAELLKTKVSQLVGKDSGKITLSSKEKGSE
jgi:lysophospholipase L1-like esterase